MEFADGIILVVRNPYNAIVSDFNRQTSDSHTGNTDLTKFKGKEWDDFVFRHSKKWERVKNFLIFSQNLLILFYTPF